ncbi:hypothetical protein BIU88_04760 [Chlorobaculum limnaeum]|uniref:Uncharacterized protein n=1 Tax=Chlorobaculum limnaeum TaxID=274537 RepID=A0A1D8CX63_CHLLM|nr:hypothetical protein BIU88_04760 [Chlorobaculum limnaeum]
MGFCRGGFHAGSAERLLGIFLGIVSFVCGAFGSIARQALGAPRGRLDNLAVSPGMTNGSVEAPVLCSSIGKGRA